MFKGESIEDEVKVQAREKEYSSNKAFVGSESILAFTLNKMGNHWNIAGRGADNLI